MDTMYVEMSGGAWEGWTYSDGQRVYLLRKYDLSDVEVWARQNHFRIIMV